MPRQTPAQIKRNRIARDYKDLLSEEYALVAHAVEVGRLSMATELGALPEWQPISWAYAKYGRRLVDNYVGMGLVSARKDGDAQSSQRRINRIELETALLSSNRIAYIRKKYGEKADTEFSTK